MRMAQWFPTTGRYLSLKRYFSFQHVTKLLTARQLSSLYTSNLITYRTIAPEHLSKHLALRLNTANEILAQAAADSTSLRKAALPQRCDVSGQRIGMVAAFAVKLRASQLGFNLKFQLHAIKSSCHFIH